MKVFFALKSARPSIITGAKLSTYEMIFFLRLIFKSRMVVCYKNHAIFITYYYYHFTFTI